MTKLIALTFGALTKLADFSGSTEPVTMSSENGGKEEPKMDAGFTPPNPATVHMAKFEPEFRFNIEVHLPSNGTEEIYLNIFSALRKVLA